MRSRNSPWCAKFWTARSRFAPPRKGEATVKTSSARRPWRERAPERTAAGPSPRRTMQRPGFGETMKWTAIERGGENLRTPARGEQGREGQDRRSQRQANPRLTPNTPLPFLHSRYLPSLTRRIPGYFRVIPSLPGLYLGPSAVFYPLAWLPSSRVLKRYPTK
jgi:hypothetical protein